MVTVTVIVRIVWTNVLIPTTVLLQLLKVTTAAQNCPVFDSYSLDELLKKWSPSLSPRMEHCALDMPSLPPIQSLLVTHQPEFYSKHSIINILLQYSRPKSFNLPSLGILFNDDAIPPPLASAFVRAAQRLEQSLWRSPYHWEAYPSHMLHTLFDPSMFPFVSGVTQVQNELGQLSIARLPPSTDPDRSANYQMIPTDVYIDTLTKQVQLKSYINNLHPERNPELYEAISEILEIGVLPLFEKVLGTVLGSDSPLNLAGRTLQIALSMKGIHLKQDLSRFPGSSWHIEGLKNEHIVSTVIYYYDVLNIRSWLEFGVEMPKNSSALAEFMRLGRIESVQGRLVAFPNLFHHKVDGFGLFGNAKDGLFGHRKILVFFLLDPNRRIESTSRIPAQQAGWYSSNLNNTWGIDKDESVSFSAEKAEEYRKEFLAERDARKCCGGGGKNRD